MSWYITLLFCLLAYVWAYFINRIDNRLLHWTGISEVLLVIFMVIAILFNPFALLAIWSISK